MLEVLIEVQSYALTGPAPTYGNRNFSDLRNWFEPRKRNVGPLENAGTRLSADLC